MCPKDTRSWMRREADELLEAIISYSGDRNIFRLLWGNFSQEASSSEFLNLLDWGVGDLLNKRLLALRKVAIWKEVWKYLPGWRHHQKFYPLNK